MAGLHLPVDILFRSLAEVPGSRAIGVVLSGNASDGSLGLRAIKAECGITFAQDESDSQVRRNVAKCHRIWSGGLRAAAR